MNRDANPFFGTNQPSQVSGPDELLARERDLAVFYDTTKPLVDRMVCAARAVDSLRADNAALAARCGELQAAIDELVAVTDLREKLGAIDDPAPKGWREWRDDYTRRHPLAWAAARAIASQAEGER